MPLHSTANFVRSTRAAIRRGTRRGLREEAKKGKLSRRGASFLFDQEIEHRQDPVAARAKVRERMEWQANHAIYSQAVEQTGLSKLLPRKHYQWIKQHIVAFIENDPHIVRVVAGIFYEHIPKEKHAEILRDLAEEISTIRAQVRRHKKGID